MTSAFSPAERSGNHHVLPARTSRAAVAVAVAVVLTAACGGSSPEAIPILRALRYPDGRVFVDGQWCAKDETLEVERRDGGRRVEVRLMGVPQTQYDCGSGGMIPHRLPKGATLVDASTGREVEIEDPD